MLVIVYSNCCSDLFRNYTVQNLRLFTAAESCANNPRALPNTPNYSPSSAELKKPQNMGGPPNLKRHHGIAAKR
jgi:hypothetical protein